MKFGKISSFLEVVLLILWYNLEFVKKFWKNYLNFSLTVGALVSSEETRTVLSL